MQEKISSDKKLQEKREGELEKMQNDMREEQSKFKAYQTPQKDENTPNSPKKCCICLDRDMETAMNCGHPMCSHCAQSGKKCPLCQEEMKEDEKTNKITALQEELKGEEEMQNKIQEELAKLRQEINERNDLKKCCICFEREMDVVLSCGHPLCNQCIMPSHKCPRCQEEVTQGY